VLCHVVDGGSVGGFHPLTVSLENSLVLFSYNCPLKILLNCDFEDLLLQMMVMIIITPITPAV